MKGFSRGAVLSALFFAAIGLAESRIINGVIVPEGAFPEVLQIRIDGAACTATLVGPRTILTAGHCARDGAVIKFSSGGKEYAAKAFRHPAFAAKDFDVAVAISPKIIEGVRPMRLGDGVKPGDPVFLLGYGCTEAGGGGGNDGKLRIGESSVTGFTGNDFISNKDDGGALCFGDSGGPAYRYIDGVYEMAGINSKGNIADTNYSANLSLPDNLNFLLAVAEEQGVEICGLNSLCEEDAVLAPKFKDRVLDLSLSSGSAFSHDLPSLLESPLSDVIWTLDPEAPKWMLLKGETLLLTPPHDATGTFLLSLTAKNKQGADAMLLRVTLGGSPEPRPQCTLTATPAFVKLGEPVTILMSYQGVVSSAHIDAPDGVEAEGTMVIVPSAVGVFVVRGHVEGPGGVGTCLTRYAVK